MPPSNTAANVTYVSSLPLGKGPFGSYTVGTHSVETITTGIVPSTGHVLALDLACSSGVSTLDLLDDVQPHSYDETVIILRDPTYLAHKLLASCIVADRTVRVVRHVDQLLRTIGTGVRTAIEAELGTGHDLLGQLRQMDLSEPLSDDDYLTAAEACGIDVAEVGEWLTICRPALDALVRSAKRRRAPELTFQAAHLAQTMPPDANAVTTLAYWRGGALAGAGHMDADAVLNVSDVPTPVWVRWVNRAAAAKLILRTEPIRALFVDVTYTEPPVPNTVHEVLGTGIGGVDLCRDLKSTPRDVPIVLIADDADQWIEAALEVLDDRSVAGDIRHLRDVSRALNEIRHSMNWKSDYGYMHDMLNRHTSVSGSPPLLLHRTLKNDDILRRLVAAAVAGMPSLETFADSFDGEMSLITRRLTHFCTKLRGAMPSLIDTSDWSTLRDFAERNDAYLAGWIARHVNLFDEDYLLRLWPELRDIKGTA